MSDYRQDVVLTAEEVARIRAVEQFLRAAAAVVGEADRAALIGTRQ